MKPILSVQPTTATREGYSASAGFARTPGEQWHDTDGIHIEVRGLAPPAPLVAIVKLVETVLDATPVIVHHDRDPVPLYAELAQRGWMAQRIEGDANEFRLRLSKGS
nr:DUF2249 domain-containing protein [Rhodoferax sp.]